MHSSVDVKTYVASHLVIWSAGDERVRNRSRGPHVALCAVWDTPHAPRKALF